MKTLSALFALLALVASGSFAQTTTTTLTVPALPNWVIGGGASFFNPGPQGSADFDKQVSNGSQFYLHLAIGNLSVRNGSLYAIVRPGLEWRGFNASNGLFGAAVDADGGFASGLSGATATALSSFTAGGYAWFDVCQAVKKFQKLGHCYLEVGGEVLGGTVISTQTSTPIQLSPSIKFRLGGN